MYSSLGLTQQVNASPNVEARSLPDFNKTGTVCTIKAENFVYDETSEHSRLYQFLQHVPKKPLKDIGAMMREPITE